MTSLWLGRAHLKRDASVAALARLLVPDDPHARVAAAHRLVWSLFADDPDRRRDFLWREEKPGHFMTLSSRPPADPHDLFDLESKAFEPALEAGDALSFTLRVNPVIARPEARGQRGKRHDVVMDALRDVPDGERASARFEAISTAGRAWLARQGAAHGFTPLGPAVCDGYDRIRLPRPGKQPPAVFGVMDISGVLEVRDPAAFLTQLAAGFGRARAHGYGLMLIRRIRI